MNKLDGNTEKKWVLKGESTTTKGGKDTAKIIKIQCKHYDQALDVAKFMVHEMQVNSISSTAKTIIDANECSAEKEYTKYFNDLKNKNIFVQGIMLQSMTYADFYQIELSKRLAGLSIWTDAVYEGHMWDHKPKIAALFQTNGNSTPYYHKYKGYEYFYDIWSNIHYGYVGRVCKFSADTLLDGAGAAQLIIDALKPGKTVTDRSAVNGQGWRKYDDSTDNISVRIGIQLHQEFPNPKNITTQILMDRIEKSQLPIKKGSKIIHNCVASPGKK